MGAGKTVRYKLEMRVWRTLWNKAFILSFRDSSTKSELSCPCQESDFLIVEGVSCHQSEGPVYIWWVQLVTQAIFFSKSSSCNLWGTISKVTLQELEIQTKPIWEKKVSCLTYGKQKKFLHPTKTVMYHRGNVPGLSSEGFYFFGFKNPLFMIPGSHSAVLDKIPFKKKKKQTSLYVLVIWAWLYRIFWQLWLVKSLYLAEWCQM